MRLLAIATAAAISVVAARPAAAQHFLQLGIGGGTAIPVGVLDGGYKEGPSGLASLAVGSEDTPIGLRFDYTYDGLRGKTVGEAVYQDIHINSLTANLVVPFRVAYVKPYLIGGAGWYSMSLPDADGREGDWGENVGAGIGFPLPYSTIGAFIEVRYHDVNRSNTHPYHYVPITFGILF